MDMVYYCLIFSQVQETNVTEKQVCVLWESDLVLTNTSRHSLAAQFGRVLHFQEHIV